MALDFLEGSINASDAIASLARKARRLPSGQEAARSLPSPTGPGAFGSGRGGSGPIDLSSWGEWASTQLRRRRLAAAANRRLGRSDPAAVPPPASTAGAEAVPEPDLSLSSRRPGGDLAAAEWDSLAPRSGPAAGASSDLPRLPSCICSICQTATVSAGSRQPQTDSVSADRAIAFRRPPGPARVSQPNATVVSAAVMDAPAIREADVFLLETNPGADKTIYLNFVGANLTGTDWDTKSWNGVSPAFSLDSDTNTFSSSELAAIKEIFARVACDFAPFDVNITTRPQSSDRIARSSASDTIYGTVCLFSNISSQTGFANAGGVAYIGIFADVNSESKKPALVFPNRLSNNPKNIAEAASHEIGHNLGLTHDGTRRDAYYRGQGSNPGWAPIMGVGYYKQLVQFSRGSYTGANNTQNDLAIITANGFGYWSDVVGNTAATALPLTLTDADGDGSSDRLLQGGSIDLTAANGLGTPDRDVYSFVAPSDGSVSIDIFNSLLYYDPGLAQNVYARVPAGYGNLRLDAQLTDGSGVVISDWNNDAELDITNFNVTDLLAGQTYYLSVFANANSPDGEDTYGSLGHYGIDLTYQSQATSLPSITVDSTSISLAEDSGTPYTLTFERSGPTTQPLTAFYRLSGTASVGVDYRGPSPGVNRLSFAAGSATATVELTPIADQLIEPDESLNLVLLHGSDYGITSNSSAVVTLVNDDAITYTLSAPSLVCEGQRVTIGISTRCLPSGTALTWRLTGTGISTADLTPSSLSGTVRLDKAGQASVSFSLNADLIPEGGSETMLFTLFDTRKQQVAVSSLQILDTVSLWGTSGNDTITGQNHVCELITAVSASGNQNSPTGAGQVDVVTGGSGTDLFQLSQLRSRRLQVFYDDGNARSTGLNDYLQIQDFNSSEDLLRFAGGVYFSLNNGNDTQIWWDRNNNGSLSTTDNTSSSDELIAILKDVQLGSLRISSTAAPSWVAYT